MNKKFIAGAALSGLVLTGGIAGMVSAQVAARATGLSEAQIVEIALLEVPGEVTEVEQENERGKQIFEVEILTAEGVEMEIEVAADTGEILEVSAEGEDDDDDDEDCEKDGGHDA